MLQRRLVRTQSIIFTLMGDFLRSRGGEFTVGSIIKMLQPLGYTDQAVRSALSRMCGNKWLRNKRVGHKSYYRLTNKSVELLERGYHRIFFTRQRSNGWNGQWQILAYSIPEGKRNLRARLRKELTWLGYGPLSYGCWISPYDSFAEIQKVADSLGISQNIHVFRADFLGLANQKELVSRCWNLRKVNETYNVFYKKFFSEFQNLQQKKIMEKRLDPVECFVERVLLLHEYRKFPFMDPGLPLELLPDDWIGIKVIDFVNEYREWLAEPANAFVNSVLASENSLSNSSL